MARPTDRSADDDRTDREPTNSDTNENRPASANTDRRTFLQGSAAALGAGALGAGATTAAGKGPTGGSGETTEATADRAGRVATARGADGMVSSVSPDATAVGAQVLEEGGNAVDAAVATQFALNTVQPHSSGIGGGGFMLVYDAGEEEVYSIDNRERAPFGADPEMFLRDGEPIPFDERITTGQAIGVPGTLKACDIALKRFGTREIADLIDPAIGLAESATVDQYLADTIAEEMGKFNDTAREVFVPDGEPLDAGDTLSQPDLADTFRLIADEGVGALYKGEIGAAIADVVQERGGSMTEADLGAYNVTIDIPEYGSYGDYEVRTQSLPSSGGLTIAQILALLSEYDLSEYDRESGAFYNLLAQVFSLAFADRGAYMGDKLFVDAPWQGMLDEDYLTERRELIGDTAPSGTAEPGDPWSYQPGDPYAIDPLTENDVSGASDSGSSDTDQERIVATNRGQTTHFTVADGDGNLVSWTTTIEQLFGSGVMVPEYGVMLNNELTDFDAVPGGPNQVEPLKRPLSSTSPTIVFENGSPAFTVGSPGGPTIITTVSQVILNIAAYGMSIPEAIATPRIYTSDSPTLYIEEFVPDAVRADLRDRGYDLSLDIPQLGNVQMIGVNDGYLGAADFRRSGAAE
jgi:gamma-glutamyltranspeptidase / glutathione hydrolase